VAKSIGVRAVAGVLLTAVCPGRALAGDYVVIPLTATVDRPAELVWKRVSGYCDIGAWLKTTCVITSGRDGEVGAVRRIADRIDEVLVARSEHGYVYAQPKSPIDYHGSVEVRADGPHRSVILYTLIYDAEPLKSAEAKAADRAQRAARFTAILETMKTIAEAR
jgi:hypothetical protein